MDSNPYPCISPCSLYCQLKSFFFGFLIATIKYDRETFRSIPVQDLAPFSRKLEQFMALANCQVEKKKEK